MKPASSSSLLKAGLLLSLSLLLPLASTAAPITWDVPTTATADTDVSTIGVLDRAFNFGTTGVSSTTINGVLFSPFVVTGTPTTVGSTTFSTNGGFGGVNTAFGDPASPFSSLSASYQTLLASAVFGNAADTQTLTLNGLNSGQSYQFQWWVNDSRASSGSGRQTIASASNSVSLEHNFQNADGGEGQFVIGTFTASGTSQVISFTATATGIGASPQVNGFQLRVIPEPSTVILGIAGASLLLFARRSRSRA